MKNPGVLFVGASKMAALATRPPVAAGGAYYWWPLPAPHMPAAAVAEVLVPGRAGEQPVPPVWRRTDDPGRKEQSAAG